MSNAVTDLSPPPPLLFATHDANDLDTWLTSVAFAYLVAPEYTRLRTEHHYSGMLRANAECVVLRNVSRTFQKHIHAHTARLYAWIRKREQSFNAYILCTNLLHTYHARTGLTHEAHRQQLPHHQLCEGALYVRKGRHCVSPASYRRKAFSWLVPASIWEAHEHRTREWCARHRLCYTSTKRAFDDALTCRDCGGWFVTHTARCYAIKQEKRIHAHMTLCGAMAAVHDELLCGVMWCTFPCCRNVAHRALNTLCARHSQYAHVMEQVVRPSTWTLLGCCDVV